LKIDADPLQSRESVFLSNLIERSWRDGKSLSLETLIGAVAEPGFDKIGALPLESVFPKKDRQGLMMALNNLLASPSFESWREGEPLDIQSLLYTKDKKPRLSVVYTAHLSDEERLFITALLLDKVKTWMRRQGGTTELRALVYMDEIFGYFPPHPANPPTKRPLLTLLKQARAQGVSIVLATQNPVDLDYKGLANMGTWMVGRLQTDQDKARLRDGLVGSGADAKAIDRLLDAVKKRVFLLHDVHRSAPCLLGSRWAMSYLRGPLTRDEIARLTKDKGGAPVRAAAAVRAGPPLLPPPFKHSYFSKYGGEVLEAHLLVKYAVRYKNAGETIGLRAYPLAASTAAEVLEADPIDVDEAKVATAPPANARFDDLPAVLASAGAKAIEKALKDRLPDKLVLTQLFDPETKTTSNPNEDRDALAARLGEGGGGTRALKVADQLAKKKRDLALREQEAKGRQTDQGSFPDGSPITGRFEHRVYGRAVQAPGPDLGPQLHHGRLGGPGRAVRPGLAHRGVRVRGAEHPGEPGDRAAGQPPRIPAAVQPLAVLHRDLPQRRQRGRLVQHALGQVRVHPDPLPVARAERPGPVPDRVRDPEAAEPVHEPGPAQLLDLLRRQAQQAAGVLRQFRYRDRMAQRERRLQVHEVRDGRQRPVGLVRRQLYGQGGFRGDDRLPGRGGLQAAEDLRGPVAHQRGQRRVELPPGPAAGQCRRAGNAADPVRHLHELGELGDPGRDRDRAGLQRARPAPPVPLLVGRADRLAHHGGQLELPGQRPGQARVLGDHPVQLPAPGDRELEPDPEPVQRRIARADQPHGRERGPYAAQLVRVLAGLQRDVVAEPLRLLVRVGVTADVDQQGGVVDRHPVLLAQTRVAGQPQRDQALPQDMLHRLAEPQVDAERQRRDQLSQPDAPDVRTPSHRVSLTFRDLRAAGREDEAFAS
jgi:hypothetical protein